MAKSEKYVLLYVGPEGSNSHAAARIAVPILAAILAKETSATISESNFQFRACDDQRVFEASLANDRNAFAVVPISNNRRGDVFDYLPFCSYEAVAEFRVPISYCLCSLSQLDEIKGIVTKTIAYQQIRDDLRPFLSDAVDLSRISDKTSTSEAAAIAAKDPSLAAICSRDAARRYGLSVLIPKIERSPIETTFGVFRNAEVFFNPPSEVAGEYDFLMRGAHVYSGRHPASGRQAFAELLSRGGILKVKWGVDPLYSSLHLGHLSNLLKLKDFIACRHKVVIIIGTFTGIVGDPSGNLSRRPPVDEKKLRENGIRLLQQIEGILGKSNFEVKWNDSLFSDFDLREFVKWMYDTDIRQIVNRPDFRNRIDFGWGLSVAEFVYPLFQARDTAQVEPDIEIGGADQLWNCILAKDILRRAGIRVPFVLLVDELKGTDGSAKMSSFEGNAINLDEEEGAIREKILRIPENLLVEYFTTLTRVDEKEVHQMDVALMLKQIDVDLLRKRLADEILSVLGRTSIRGSQ